MRPLVIAHLVTTGLGPLYDGISHVFVSPDDLIPVIAMAVLSGMNGAAAGRRMLLLLPVAWLAAGFAGARLGAPSLPQSLTAVSFLLLGILTALGRRLPVPLVGVLAVCVGGFHGWLNGVAIAQSQREAMGLIGITIAVFGLAALMSAFALSREAAWTRIALRTAGSWIAAIGLLMLGWTLRVALILCVVLATVAGTAPSAEAQTNFQLWGNITLERLKTDRLTTGLDFEPKVLVASSNDEPAWRNLDVTPSLEYSLKNWLDLVSEIGLGYTLQTDDVDTFEATPRAGVRFHLLSRAPLHAALFGRERQPKRRVVVRDLVRVESRNLFYFGAAAGTDSTVRFRNRFEVQMPMNKPKTTDDGARSLLADWEWFIPLGDPAERFANKQRIRAGLGYRPNFTWRFEALYIWTRSRSTVDEPFETSDHIVDLRLKRVW